MSWMDAGDFDGPDDEAYGRVTNPERFRGLHASARELLDDLSAKFDVTRTLGREADGELSERGNTNDVVRLAPTDGDGAPIGVAFTAFPGLIVRFGRWHVAAYPDCGCDACDLVPTQVAQELRDHVAAVTSGQFAERLKHGVRPTLAHSFEPGNEGWSRLTHARAKRLGRPAELRWAAWPRR
jgi:hypothetical protein